jgi:hypothetical protein
MTWNHRVMRHVDPNGGIWFGIHEVYYDESGEPEGWTETPDGPHGETVEQLVADLARMIEASGRPVLEYEDGKAVTRKARSEEDRRVER